MGKEIHIEVWTVCAVCQGKGWIRLNHAASATCWACHNGEWLSMNDTQSWTSFERCFSDMDPFQNGAHTTWPGFMVNREIERWEGQMQDLAFA